MKPPYCPMCGKDIGIRYVEKITPSKYAFEFRCQSCNAVFSVVSDSGAYDAIHTFREVWNSGLHF